MDIMAPDHIGELVLAGAGVTPIMDTTDTHIITEILITTGIHIMEILTTTRIILTYHIIEEDETLIIPDPQQEAEPMTSMQEAQVLTVDTKMNVESIRTM